MVFPVRINSADEEDPYLPDLLSDMRELFFVDDPDDPNGGKRKTNLSDYIRADDTESKNILTKSIMKVIQRTLKTSKD